jgi:prepilin-type N-terminal cleavage/methylation domain-containing protein
VRRLSILRARLSGARADDGGFSLVEVIASMAVLGIGAAAALTAFVAAGGMSRNVILRTTAANLLTRQIESVRAVKTTVVPDGRQVSTQVVSGTTFTITQDVSYVTPGSSTTVCTGTGSTLAYKLVTVTITWPGMGTTRPIRGDTLKAVGVGQDGYDPSTGSLAVLVAGTTGTPTAGVTVTLSPGGAAETTGSDGCAVFPALAPGSYTATVSVPGYVGTSNTTTATLNNLGVAAQSVRRGTLYYDTAGALDVTTDAPAGSVYPSGLTLRLGDTYLPESAAATCPAAGACTTGVPGHVSGLFPEVYDVSLGACTSTPRSTVSVDLRGTSTPPTATVPVGTVTVDVRVGGTSMPGRTVTATRGADGGCPSGETLTLPATQAGGTRLVLPYGTWTLTTPSGVAPAMVTLGPGAASASALLVASS